MYKLILFSILLNKKIREKDLLSKANDLTFKILLSLFPLLIFFMTIVAFLELDIYYLARGLEGTVPLEVLSIFDLFLVEVVGTKRPSLLSTSLIFAIASSTSGFKSLVEAINKAYDEEDKRSFIKVYALSFIMVVAFIFSLVVSIILLIFGNSIITALEIYFYMPPFMPTAFKILSNVVSIIVMLITTILINKLAISRKVTLKSLLPGSLFTVVIWVIASTAFSLYISTFGRMASIYGSVAGIMILMIWVNIICIVLIIGTAMNAMLDDYKEKK